jgi:hypothetical protein
VYEQVFDREWIKSNMPGAEVRRQRAAYARGIRVIILPALLILVVASYFPISIYRQSVAAPQASKTPVPPPFWASFSASSAATSNLGALVINAGQAGVAVSINKREYGLTNATGELTVPLLEAGTYILGVQKPGYQALIQEVKIEPQKQTQLTVELMRPVIAGSSATIEGAPPGAEVRLDGKLLGTTAADGTFLLTPIPGEHTVQVAKEGFLPLQTKEMFAPGKSVTRKATLEPDAEFQRWQTLSSNATLPEIDRFIRDYPSGRFTAQARTLQEQTQWNVLKNGKDLEALAAFVNKFPQGAHLSEARTLMLDLQTEQEEWVSARASKDTAQLQAYLAKHPQGQYAGVARDEITKLSSLVTAAPSKMDDNEAVLEVIKEYERAYDNRSVDDVKKIWPGMTPPQIDSLTTFFRLGSSVTLTCSISGEPEIRGDQATVRFTRSLSYVMDGKQEKQTAKVTVKLRRVTLPNSPQTWQIVSFGK